MTRAKAPAMPEIKDPPEEGHPDAPDFQPEVSQTPPVAEAEAAKALAEQAGLDLALRPVIVKLARIMAELPTLQPEGRNTHFGYNYIKDTQINSVVRPRMARERLMVIPEVLEESWVETKTAKGGTSWVTKLKIRFTVIDGDSGDSVSGTGIGYGDDSGDKGANKAFTAAMKYWILKLFQIGGEDDLESDARADSRASDRESGAGPASVRIEGAVIEGVARGGQSVKITLAQMKQIFALYKDLELTPEGFVTRIDAYLNDSLVIDEDGDVTAALNAYLKQLDADDAGKLITALVDEKDKAEAKANDLAGEAYG